MAAFLTVVQGLLTLVIGGIAIWIAYQQHKTARDKLKLDLFDRRYKVYRGLMDFLGAVNADGKPSRDAFGQFYRETDPKRFLFGDDVCDYLEEIREKAVELRQAIELGAAARADKCRTISQERLMEASETERDLVGWFYKRVEEASQKFQPYLGFKKSL